MAVVKHVFGTVKRLWPSTVAISGTVTLGGAPAARTVELYCCNVLLDTAVSDSETGAYAFEAPGGPNTRFRVIMVGDEVLEEATLIFDRIVE